MAKANYKQIKKIYAMAKELNLDNDLLHTVVFNTTGVEHISALTSGEAVKLIDELEYKKTGVRKQKTFRRNMATEDQLYKIKALEVALGWDGNPRRLKGFMRKYTHVEDVKWLTFGAASDLIEAMKKVFEREQEKALSNTMSD